MQTHTLSKISPQPRTTETVFTCSLKGKKGITVNIQVSKSPELETIYNQEWLNLETVSLSISLHFLGSQNSQTKA